jgi:hypothetical protein
MAHEPIPNEPYRSPDDSYLSNLSDDDIRRSARFDNDLQMIPELTGEPAGGAKVAMFAIAVAVVLGAIFYGLNNTSVHQAGTSATAQNTTETSPPAAPPGMRDVTPRRANTDQDVTTGAAPVRPQMPPATAPREMNRPGNPPANNAPGK